MGGDGHGRSRKRRPSISPARSLGGGFSASSTEEEEGRRRRSGKRRSHMAGDGEREKGRGEKKRRREEKKGEKSHKKNRKERDEKKRIKKKSKEKEKHRSTGGMASDSFEELTKDDYFSKNNEFSTWLKEERGIFFSELTSEMSRDMFSKFVKEWNGGRLQPRYYEGIASGPRTGHDWKIRA